MPKEGISIIFTMKDGASQVLSSIHDKTKALDKETQQLAQSTAAMEKATKGLYTVQGKLKTELDAANKKVKEAQKAYEEYGDELSKSKLDRAIQEQANLKQSLTEVDAQIKANRKTYSEYVETVRKNTAGSGASGAGLDATSMALGLISGTAGDMLSASLGGIAESLLTSAIGVPQASVITNGISDAISGALAGSVFGPWGALAGGTIGAITGALSGGTEIYEAKDDAFKEYYASLYEDVNANTESMISSGSVTAGSREQTQKAFAKRLGGDAEADAYLDRVKTMAAGTNYDYDEITGYSQLLLNSYDPDAVFGVLQSLSDATAGLKLSSSDVEVMISGLSRMRTTGKATQDYLNYFSERGVDVYAALSEAYQEQGKDVQKSDIAGMVTKGSIGGEFAAQAILDFIDRNYGGLSEDLMGTYDAMTANLEDIMTTLNAAGGEGYNEMRKSGLEAEMEAYSGALGEAIEEINRISGENKAYLENLSGQYQREALSAVLMGEETTLFNDEQKDALTAMAKEYKAASKEYNSGNQKAGLTMERLKEEAEALATAAYESSDQYLEAQENELAEIKAIRDNTAGLPAATNAYLKNQELSKGQGAVNLDNMKEEANTFFANRNALSDSEYALTGYDEDELRQAMETGTLDLYLANANSHAFGLERVPYDNYPALLHQDERVLTASEAREQDASERRVIQITVTGNSFVGTGEEMADQLAEILARKLENAAVIAVPR